MAPVAPSATRRLFIAVMLPAAVQERLARLTGLLAAHRAILRPTRPEGLHFTLRFLGNMTPAQEQQIEEAVAAAADGARAFPLAIRGFGAFPNARAGPRHRRRREPGAQCPHAAGLQVYCAGRMAIGVKRR